VNRNRTKDKKIRNIRGLGVGLEVKDRMGLNTTSPTFATPSLKASQIGSSRAFASIHTTHLCFKSLISV